jgi:hypothetical protein
MRESYYVSYSLCCLRLIASLWYCTTSADPFQYLVSRYTGRTENIILYSALAKRRKKRECVREGTLPSGIRDWGGSRYATCATLQVLQALDSIRPNDKASQGTFATHHQLTMQNLFLSYLGGYQSLSRYLAALIPAN